MEFLEDLHTFVVNYMTLPKEMENAFQQKIRTKYPTLMTRQITELDRGYAEAIYEGVFGFDPKSKIIEMEAKASEATAKASEAAAKASEAAAKAKINEERFLSTSKNSIFALSKFGVSAEKISEELNLDLPFVLEVLKAGLSKKRKPTPKK